jgi:regulator of ribosome biosynthesis
MNSHGVNEGKLYKSKSRNHADDRVTIEAENFHMTIDEEYLLQKATDGCHQLLSVLWQLPVERSDAGPLGTLPKYDEIPLPRSLPPPPPKQLSKWEKFAKEKGLPLNKSKRSRKVWDEATNSWKYRHGYEKANDDTKEWPIMEVKANQDPFEDPWERARDEKKSRREHNQESHMKNMERAGALPKGTAKSVVKQRLSAREVGKAGGNKDRDNVPPAGVPVDLKPSKDGVIAKRGKESTVAALLATQKSTASLGRFDKMLEGEPARKKALSSMKKRKFESDSDKKVLATESERSMKLLKSVVEGGGVAKEKARKKGHLAHGETGYDYDYDDGLGASSFRKKKGRAGAGKAKKMTKKRIK